MFKAKSITPRPILFQGQPASFAILNDKDDLKAWESQLAKELGVDDAVVAQLAEAIVASGGTCCESNSTNDCDKD